jgi:hypothetical protein
VVAWKRQIRRSWRYVIVSIPWIAGLPQVRSHSQDSSPEGKNKQVILGNLLLRFYTDGRIATFPYTDDPRHLANHFLALLELLHTHPLLAQAICGVEEVRR